MKTSPKLLVGIGLLATGCSTKAVVEERPNVLFILSDDHTSQAWGIYGGIHATYAPNENIQRLAEEGCVLDNSFCTNSISVPSRASILTGAYSHKNGAKVLWTGLDGEHDNIAKQAQRGGYQTAIFGKWHLHNKPQGFDTWEVFHDQGEYNNPVFQNESNWVKGKNVGDTVVGFSTDIVADKTINWIENRDKKQPFMAYCHFKATHEPWDFPERNKDLYKDMVFPYPEDMLELDWESTGRTFHGQQLENLATRWETATETGKWWCDYPELPFKREGKSKTEDRKQVYQKLMRDYMRCAAAIDQNIGRLLDYLDESGLAENTIVVYVSDQGYFLGEHGMFDKRMMLEQSLRMPFVIRYPKEIPAGTRLDDIVLNIDHAALLADYTGINAPALSQGRSYRENLKGNTPDDWRKSMYYRYWTQETVRPAHFGVRNDRYKLMFLYGLPHEPKEVAKAQKFEPTWEFYDLQEDPKEMRNAYNNPKYAETIKEMKAEIVRLRKEYDDTDANYPQLLELLEKEGLTASNN